MCVLLVKTYKMTSSNVSILMWILFSTNLMVKNEFEEYLSLLTRSDIMIKIIG